MAEKAVVEEVKNCPSCKKPMKKARRFYRNGAYFCNSNCFKKADAIAKTAKAEAASKAAAEAAEATAKAAAAVEAAPAEEAKG